LRATIAILYLVTFGSIVGYSYFNSGGRGIPGVAIPSRPFSLRELATGVALVKRFGHKPKTVPSSIREPLPHSPGPE
jgi:hypothetical protein